MTQNQASLLIIVRVHRIFLSCFVQPWYRIDKQIMWRCRYCWKKLRWYIMILSLLFLAAVVAFAILHKEGYF